MLHVARREVKRDQSPGLQRPGDAAGLLRGQHVKRRPAVHVGVTKRAVVIGAIRDDLVEQIIDRILVAFKG